VSSDSRSQARQSKLARAIRSLPQEASSTLATLNPEIPLSRQARQCDCCGTIIASPSHGLQRFCSAACNGRWWMAVPERKAKTHNSETWRKSGDGRRAWLQSGHPKAKAEIERVAALRPTRKPECRAKVSASLKAIGHKPSILGGNGRGPTKPQALLAEVLGEAWTMEYAVPLGGRFLGYPTNYKLDLALPSLRIGIEVDGSSHHTIKGKERDAKKDAKLASLGWTVLRFSNRAILDWINSGMPMESSISTTFKRHGINPSPSKDC
jgi:hypothetical protein